MVNGHDRDIAAFVVALLGLKGISLKRVKDLLAEEGARIGAAGRLDADFVVEMSAAGASKAVTAVRRALEASEATGEELENRAFETLALAEDGNVHVLHPLMGAYPQRLLRNPSYPPILFCRGDAGVLNAEKAVAVIGTRNPTDFGYRMGRRLAHSGEMLREEFMPDYGLSVAQLATKIGVSRQTVNQLVSERRALSPSMALRLARLLRTKDIHVEAVSDSGMLLHCGIRS